MSHYVTLGFHPTSTSPPPKYCTWPTIISSLFLEGWKNLNGMGAANFSEHPGSYGFLQEFLCSWGQSHWSSAQGLPSLFLQRMGPLGGSDSGQSRKRLCSTIHRGGEGKARVFTCLKWGHSSPFAVWLRSCTPLIDSSLLTPESQIQGWFWVLLTGISAVFDTIHTEFCGFWEIAFWGC